MNDAFVSVLPPPVVKIWIYVSNKISYFYAQLNLYTNYGYKIQQK